MVIWWLGGVQTQPDDHRSELFVVKMSDVCEQQPAEVLPRQSELEAETVLSKDKWIGRAAD